MSETPRWVPRAKFQKLPHPVLDYSIIQLSTGKLSVVTVHQLRGG